MENLGSRVKEVRQQAGLTQKEFALELGISQNHVSNIENGKEKVSLPIIKLISYKFNIDEEWLLSGRGSSIPQFDLSSREGAIALYNSVRKKTEKLLMNCNEDESVLVATVFDSLISVLTVPFGMVGSELDAAGRKQYIGALRSLLVEVEKLIYSVTLKKGLLPAATDVEGWIQFRSAADTRLKKICGEAKTATNLYLSDFGKGMEL